MTPRSVSHQDHTGTSQTNTCIKYGNRSYAVFGDLMQILHHPLSVFHEKLRYGSLSRAGKKKKTRKQTIAYSAAPYMGPECKMCM